MEQKEQGAYSPFSLNLLNLLTYGIVAIFTSYLQLYYLSSGLDKLQIGVLLAAGPAISLIAYPFWNLLWNNQLNTRNTLLLLLAGVLFSIHLLLWVGQTPYLIWSSLLLFFFLSPITGVVNALTLEFSSLGPLQTGARFRIGRFWGSIGLAVVPFTVSLPFSKNMAMAFTLPDLIILTMLIGLAIAMTISLPSLRKQNQTPPLRAREIAGVLLNKYFMTFVFLGMLIAVPITVNMMFMPLFITDLGGNLLDVAFALFFASILEAGIFYLLNRFLKKKMASLMLCLTFVSLILTLRWNLMSDATLPVHVILIQVFNAVTLGGFFYTGIQLTSLFLPKPFRSAGQTICIVCWSGIAGIVAGLLGGLLFQSFGAVILYKTLGSMGLCGALGFALMWVYIHYNGYKPSQFHS